MSHPQIYPARTFTIAALIVAILLGSLPQDAHAGPPRRGDAQLARPQAYLVILDATSSMSWNFAGQGTKHGRDIQCGSTGDPGIYPLYCGAGAPWRRARERRIYAAKQAIQLLIDRLDSNSTMRLVAFSTKGISANQRWTSSRRSLRQELRSLGAYQGEPYRTAGAAPSASALFAARQLLAQMPRSAPNGQPYGQPIVIFITDSIANRFLKANGGWENRPNDTCPGVPFADEIATCQIGFTSSVPPLPKPITAMLMQADLLKQAAIVYVIALAGVDELGLKEVASAPSFPFFATARGPEELMGIIETIQVSVIGPASGSPLPSAP